MPDSARPGGARPGTIARVRGKHPTKPREPWLQRALGPVILALIAVGFILTTGYFVDLPASVMGLALVLAAVALPLFFAAAVASSRAEGVSVFRSIGRAAHATFRVICDLF